MFGINTKQGFVQKMYDIISILFIIHVVAVTLMYIIKWIHPYLKKRAEAHYKHKTKVNNDCTGNKIKTLCKLGGELSEEEFVRTLENLKTLIDIGDNPTKLIFDSSVTKINMMSDSDFERALNLGSFLRTLSKSKTSSSEVQTNITVNPKIKLDYSSLELPCTDPPPERRPLKATDSSTSFFSVSSMKSEGVKSELQQIIDELEMNDDIPNNRIHEDKIIQKLQNYLKSSLVNNDLNTCFPQTGTTASQENRILEMAINEFEKELKPIKDQIKLLKECLSDELASRSQHVGPFSDFTSFTGSGTYTESISSTTLCCGTDLRSYFSSYHIVSATSFGSMDSESKFKKLKKLDKIATLKNKIKSNQCDQNSSEATLKEIYRSSEKLKSKKRSAIAEMYIKLSKCNSQSVCGKTVKDEKIPYSDNGMTFRIDLNVNLTGSQPLKSHKLKALKPNKVIQDSKLLPMTSDLEDILADPLICRSSSQFTTETNYS